jgi:hypothetical protein
VTRCEALPWSFGPWCAIACGFDPARPQPCPFARGPNQTEEALLDEPRKSFERYFCTGTVWNSTFECLAANAALI